MAKKISGITIEIGGETTKLEEALNGVNKKVRGTQTELREVNKLLKLDPKNTEALTQKQTLLKDAVAETKEKLDILKEAESKVQAQFEKGEVSGEQYRALKREIEKTSIELANLEKAAKQTDEEIAALGEKAVLVGDNLEEAAKQTNEAIADLGKKAVLAGDDLKKAEEKAGDFKEKLGEMKDKAMEAGAAIGAAFVGAATYATKFETDCDKALNTVITQTGATDTEIAGLEETLLNIYKNNFGEDINDIANAMSAVKQQTGLADEELQNTTQTAILMRDTFDIDVNESVRGVTAMMKQFGISSQEAYNLLAQGAQQGLNQNGDLADQLAEYAVYYADLGITAEEAFNMIANGAKDGTFQIDYLNDAVKEFGIRVKDGTAEDSFKQLGLNARDLQIKFAEGGEEAREAFDIVNQALFACDDEVQRNLLGVQLYGTKWEDLGEDAIKALTNTQGEISNTNDALSAINEQKYNDLGNQLEELGRTVNTDLVKPLGEELQPVISDVISTVKEKIPQVKEIVLAVVDKVGEFINFVASNGPMILSIIAGIAAGMLAWNVVTMIQGLVAVFKTWQAATQGMTIAQKLLNLAMAANPIGIVITVIAGLIAALVTLFATNEEFRNKVIAIWEKVKEVAENVFGAIVDFFTVTIPDAFNDLITLLYDNCKNVRDFIDTFVADIKQFFADLWTGISSIFKNVGQWFKKRFTKAYNNITTVFSGIGTWFGERWREIKKCFANVATWFGTKFKNAWTNIKNAFANVTQFFTDLWKKIKKCFVNVGTKIGNAVGDAFKKAINSCLTNIENIINKFIGMINGVIDIINEIPGVSLSKIDTVSLPRLAKGGVLREGQAMVAEAGPELLSMVNGKAVVTPLTGTARNHALENAGINNGGYNQTINITSPKALSPYEVARQTRLQTRGLVLAVQRR